MNEYGDVAALFSKHSARMIQQHRSSIGNDSEVPDLDDMNDVHSVHSAPTSSSRQTEALTQRSRSVTASLSLEEVHQQLEELENTPAPTKEEIEEMLAQYSSGSESSGSEESDDSSDDEPETVIMKVLIVGNARCGKTSTIRRFTRDDFSDEYVSTIGADFVEKLIEYDEQLTISLQLWDIAGQDRFAKFTRGYFREAKGAVIVCDITRANTIDAVVNWKNEIDTCCKDLNEGEEIPVVMVANKSDLLLDPMGALDLGVNMQKCVDKNNIVEWFRASAKSGERVEEAFQCLIDRMVEDHRAEKKEQSKENEVEKEEQSAAPEIIRLSQTPPQYRAVKQQGFGCDCN
ncbi:Ras-related protein Rab-32A [Phytophthora citrophthora]|uniref:Ras-related protein Rab-32A n=1 Tax=Phytophthora citrophthora TaxID=4793 RepID=A0AAD9GS44_9STRA|nr:Ras-related protein Rab-32A [Phytophthora citrophthora]